jgi:GNAT superfamily N-acetyltransferase
MPDDHAVAAFAPELLWRWVAARSMARGQPAPVPDHGGMRVDTGSPEEVRRHVFAGPGPGLQALLETVRTPLVYLKVCAAAGDLQAILPPRWQLQPAGYFMTQDEPPAAMPAPVPGYRIDLVQVGAVIAARMLAADGAIAASGYAVEHDGVFILDRILTDPAHRRRGLGRALVAALVSMQRDSQARRVLVATDAGCALYMTLGWRVLSPYTTIVLPAEAGTHDIAPASIA